MNKPQLLLALLLWSIAAPVAAQGASSGTVAPPPSAEVQRRLEAVEERYEEVDDRQIATAAKLEAAESAYSRFEIVTGLTGLLITLVVAAFGIFTHRAAVNAAKTEIADLKEQLRTSIQQAMTEAQLQKAEFDRQKGEILKLFDEAREAAAQVASHRDTAKATADDIARLLAEAQSGRAGSGERMAELSEADRAKVQATAGDVQAKPESDWSFDDFKARIANAALVDADRQEALRLAQALAAAHPENPEAVAFALFQQAFAHGQLGDLEREVEIYEEFDRRFGGSDAPALPKQVAMALYNKGVRLGQLGRSDVEIGAYEEVVRRFGGSNAPALQELAAKALLNKGVRLSELGRSEDAIGFCDEVVRRFGGSDAPALQEQVAIALFNKACFMARLERLTAAIAVLEQWGARRGGVDCQMIADDSEFDAIRERPRFKAFLKKHGCA